jgi:hypothetical protein
MASESQASETPMSSKPAARQASACQASSDLHLPLCLHNHEWSGTTRFMLCAFNKGWHRCRTGTGCCCWAAASMARAARCCCTALKTYRLVSSAARHRACPSVSASLANLFTNARPCAAHPASSSGCRVCRAAGWEYVGPLCVGKQTPGEEHDTGAMWECPFFVPLPAHADSGAAGSPNLSCSNPSVPASQPFGLVPDRT